MDNPKTFLARIRLARAAEALTKNGFTAHCVDTKEEACRLLLSLIPPEAKVGVGGSVTIREIGIMEELAKRGQTVIHHWVPGAAPEELRRFRTEELTADVFLASTNALTLNGELVNVDAVGNRVAAMIYGPRQVIIVAGVNKLVKDVTEGLARARNVAAPLNNLRFQHQTPCAQLGQCANCHHPERICKVTVIMEKCPSLTPITVILVGEELGY